MSANRLTQLAHHAIAQVLCAGDTAIDATVGNGHDCLFLAQQVGASGKVFGFDLQTGAVLRTQERLQQHSVAAFVELLVADHQDMLLNLPSELQGRVKAIMFNLGYLPGSDKSIVTKQQSTLSALKQAQVLLAQGGILSVMAYPGHVGGAQECLAVEQWVAQLDPAHWQSHTYFSDHPKPEAPRLMIVKKQ